VAFPETVFIPVMIILLPNINLWLAEMTINPTSQPMVYDLSQFMIDGIINFLILYPTGHHHHDIDS